MTKVSEETKEVHIQNIKNRYSISEKKSVCLKKMIMDPEETKQEIESKKVETSVSENSEPDKVCPRCGKKLILRTAKKGVNAGKQVWGCSGFPKCRYTE